MNTRVYYIVTTKGKRHLAAFTKFKSEGDYGNGTYVSIVINNESQAYSDERYNRKFQFDTFCESYIKMYWGENLLYFKFIEEDNTPF